MRRLALGFVCIALACATQQSAAGTQPDPLGNGQNPTTSSNATITIPAGTRVSLEITAPVWAKTAKPGESIYTQTTFPVVANGRMAIPVGTYVEGVIDSLSHPGFLSPHAQFQIHFTKIIFANGYTMEFPGPQNVTTAPPSVAPGQPPPPPDDVIPAVANAYVQASTSNDLLLDNGAQIEMVLQIPLQLNAESVAGAVENSASVQLAQFRSATQCRPTPGTPGTSDTVIPGTPGSPGTPSTTIPGGPGMPDIVIPGIPPTPGTPDTIIPGSPGTLGTVCPGPPVVISDSKPRNFKEAFQLDTAARVDGTQLAAGSYQAFWEASGITAKVEIRQNGNLVASGQARVVTLSRKSPASATGTRTNADGTLSLDSLRFAGQSFALYFE